MKNKDLSFLEFKDSDSEHLRDVKSYWQMMMAMPKLERDMFLLMEKVESEQFWLDSMLMSWKADRSYSLRQIREQRKRVQSWKKRLNAVRVKFVEKELNAKPKPSSNS